MSDRPNSEIARIAVKWGMPAMPTSIGMVTLRSISSADRPCVWVMTSTIGGTGSG
ncbi:hypothetical protein D9M73_118270 [compost metagenome]